MKKVECCGIINGTPVFANAPDKLLAYCPCEHVPLFDSELKPSDMQDSTRFGGNEMADEQERRGDGRSKND